MDNPKSTSLLFSTTSKTSVTTIPAKDIQTSALIGQGSYGSVYQGSWQYTTVAVKKLHLQKLTETLLEAFKQEAAIMAQSQHPNLVRLWGICLEPGHYSMVMEYMPKGSLYEVLHNPEDPLPWSPVRWQMASNISMGLTYLHAQGIIHRDLKSLNVLLGQHYHAKLADFGLARLKLGTSSTSSQQGLKTGSTIRWKAPELFKPEAKATAASDVYSCGIVLWEITSRQLPYGAGNNETTVALWIKDGRKENIPDDCPKPYAQIIQACWGEVKERPTASDIVKALKDATPQSAPKSDDNIQPPKLPLVLPPVNYQGTPENIVKTATAMLQAKEWTTEQKAYFETLIQTISLPPVQKLTGHTNAVTTLVLLPNNQLATGSSDTTIKLWDISSGQCDKTLTGHINLETAFRN